MSETSSDLSVPSVLRYIDTSTCSSFTLRWLPRLPFIVLWRGLRLTDAAWKMQSSTPPKGRPDVRMPTRCKQFTSISVVGALQITELRVCVCLHVANNSILFHLLARCKERTCAFHPIPGHPPICSGFGTWRGTLCFNHCLHHFPGRDVRLAGEE
jgi:hypothetical protein